MRELLPVTNDDLDRAWAELYQRSEPFADVPIVPPKPDDRYDQITLAALRRVLEADRRHVIERTTSNG